MGTQRSGHSRPDATIMLGIAPCMTGDDGKGWEQLDTGSHAGPTELDGPRRADAPAPQRVGGSGDHFGMDGFVRLGIGAAPETLRGGVAALLEELKAERTR